MTNQDAMRVKLFLGVLLKFHSDNRAPEGEAESERVFRDKVRSVGLSYLAESALDLLGEIEWPDEKGVAA